MTTQRLSLALLVVPMVAGALAIVAPGEANARTAELTHQVHHGESASAIARDYYGDLEAGELLLLYNGKTGTVIHVGDTLKVPYSPVHTVKAAGTTARERARFRCPGRSGAATRAAGAGTRFTSP